jgi:lysozyme family protein
MTDLNALKAVNARRWASAKTTRDMTSVAKRLVGAKQRYKTVEGRTSVPWFVVAVIHEREASQNWNTQLGQGDPLHSISTHVPAGRGPFMTWEDGAIDALVNCAPHTALNNDWGVGGTLTKLEEYNGLIYANHGRPSPYVWAGTTIYDPPTGPGGKVLVDHGPIEDVVDKQLGCAGLLMAMSLLDVSVRFDVPILPKPAPTPTERPSAPSITHPAPGSIGEFIASIFNAIFRRK